MEGVARLAKDSAAAGRTNVAFVSNFLLHNTDECLRLLCETGRTAEAAFFARTYAPGQISRIVALWRAELEKVNPKAAESLADPAQYANLFPDFELGLIAEWNASQTAKVQRPASDFVKLAGALQKDLIEAARNSGQLPPERTDAAVPAEAPKAEPEPDADAAAAKAGAAAKAEAAAKADIVLSLFH